MADEEGPRKKRRRRRGRRGRGGGHAPAPTRAVERTSAPRSEQAAPSLLPDWQWLTFPVVVAFAIGVVVTVLASSSSAAVLVLFVGSLFAVGLGLARVVTRSILARRSDR